MFDPNIKIRVIADFKYRDEVYVNAQTQLSFDIYDSSKIAELVSLFNPSFPHKEFIELPSIDSLPYHVKEQIRVTYSLDKPQDQEYIPTENKPFYETLGDTTFSPFGASPNEDTTYDPKPLADNTYQPVVVEPVFPTAQDISPSITEEVPVAPVETPVVAPVVAPVETPVTPEPIADVISPSIPAPVTDSAPVTPIVADVVADVTLPTPVVAPVVETPVDSTLGLPTPVVESTKPEYTDATKAILALTDDQLQTQSANDIKNAVLELDSSYAYSNKAEAIKYIITFRQ